MNNLFQKKPYNVENSNYNSNTCTYNPKVNVECIVNELNHEITQCITDAINAATPCKIIRGVPLPKHIVDKIKAKRYLRKQLSLSDDSDNRTHLKRIINSFTKEIRNDIKAFQESKIQTTLRNITVSQENPASFHQSIKRLLKREPQNTMIRKDDGQLVCDDVEIAEMFAKI